MNLTEIWNTVLSQTNPTTVVLFILFLTSEFLGTKENVKSSSIYQVLKAGLMAILENALPKKVPVDPPQA